MKRKHLAILLLVPLFEILALVQGCSKGQNTASGQKYHCPMHPTYISDKPGDCPICGMKLVPIKKDAPAPVATNEHAAHAKPAVQENGKTAPQVKVGQYYCSMCPGVVSDKPGKCPECKMNLKQKTEEVSATPGEHTHEMKEENSEMVPGRTAVMISADKQQLIGLKTAKVEKRPLAVAIRTTATIEHDETRLAKIAPRFSGWVRDLKVNFTGQQVEKGQPLLTVYSPELLSAENEYLLAHQRWETFQNSPGPEKDSAQRLVDSTRRRLRLWEIGDEEIDNLAKSKQARDELLVRAPVSGHVVAKAAVEGKAFMAGETLYEIADLSHLWLRAYVYEYEFPLIRMGQKAEVLLPYLGNKVYPSQITFLYPHIEQQTRRAEIRLEVDNPNHELRPAMWADVSIQASYGNVLSVPAGAVIDTGTRFVAFVRKGDEHLEPRELKIGARTDDFWEVTRGVEEEEEVVSRALFLVDSESQLKAAIEGMGAAGKHQH